MKIITIGGCGSNIAMGLLNDNAFKTVSIDIIDSVIPSIKLDDINHAQAICIQDAYTGSGRDENEQKHCSRSIQRTLLLKRYTTMSHRQETNQYS